MIVYNTTFHLSEADVATFLDYLKATYLELSLRPGIATEPKLMRIMAQNDGTVSFALQLHFASLDTLRTWQQAVGQELTHILTTTWGQRVVGFSTMMKTLEL